ncbi:MAG: glycosyltransferase [Streptosporangiaceae bacterium]
MGNASEENGGRRILFVTASSWGHINPLISMAGELTARGAGDIWFASTDDRQGEIEAISPGQSVRFASLGPAKPELEPANWPEETVRAMTTSSPLRNFAAVVDINIDHSYSRQQYLRTLEIIDDVRPALAVIDLSASWAIDAAGLRGVPYVLSCPMPVSDAYAERLPWDYPAPYSGLPRDMSAGQKARNIAFRLGALGVLMRPKYLRPNLAYVRARQAEGLPNPSLRKSRYADGAVAVLAHSVFGIEYPFPDVPANVRMLGAIISRDLDTTVTDDDLARWLDAHESVVYVAFGTVMRPTSQQIQAVLDAAARLWPEHRLLWKLPRSRHHLLPGELPPNVRIEAWVPSQLAVLAHPHVRAFLNHGGGNSLHEGLYFGKPQLVMPFWMDNLDAAVRAIDSGAGLAVAHPHNPDPGDIAAKLTRLLDEPAFRSRAEHWSEQIRAAGGVVSAADEITGALDRLAGVSSLTSPAA